jgi:hypothetical protein
MQSALTAKENLNADTPILLFDCTLADGSTKHWSSSSFNMDGVQYEGRVLRHNVFEAQLASDTQVGGAPRLTFELANADSSLSEIEQQTGFKGAKLLVRVIFADLSAAAATTDALVVFSGLMNPPDLITETTFRLSAMNRMATQRSVVPEVRVQRLCPWRFPMTAEQRLEAVNGGDSRGKFSPFYRCGYSPDQVGGTGNLNGSAPFADCSRTRQDCEQRGMFSNDSSGRRTARFGGIEFVPPTILVRGSGQKNYSLSAVQDNQVRYNDFVPLVYGTQWHSPDVVFSRNDGNLTRMEVLLGLGETQGILKVLVNNSEIPQGVSGTNMTSTGWYNIISAGGREGQQDPNFADGHGAAIGDPYGSMAYISIVVPNRVNDGTSVPSVQILMQGLKVTQFDLTGNSLGDSFSDNPAWVLYDLLRRSGYPAEELDASSFARAAAYAGELIDAVDPVGGQVQIPRFQCDFAIKQRRSTGDVVRSIRNSSRIYLILNTAGKLEARVENTFALQQPSKPAGSNATSTFNGGWPAYEFDATSIARGNDGGATVRLLAKNAQDTPNRLSIEFQDSFNQYQQDSLSLSNGNDADLSGQEVAANWDAVGVSSFHQATRTLLLGLNRAGEGNRYIEFETSVKALGLMPGDLITVSYLKENLQRTPFRILKIAPGASFRTAVITAQFHDDAWYSDAVTGILGGRGWQSGQGPGLPSPVGGTVAGVDGALELGVKETEVAGNDGSANVELDVSFTSPSGSQGSLVAPLVGLVASVDMTTGTLAGGVNYFYAVSAVDSAGGESPLSFVVQANAPAGSSTNSVLLSGIGLPAGAAGFHVYRGTMARQLFRIASNQTPATSFMDAGLPLQAILPPDAQFEHVNLYWRWEWLPETPATIQTSTTVGNSILRMQPDRYVGATVRITRGTGKAQERLVMSNDADTITVDQPWTVTPDLTSSFVISENSWRFGAKSATSPVLLTLPERIGTTAQLSARAANSADGEAAYDLSPLTRWTIGQSGALLADSDVPPAPLFGAGVSPSRGGVVDLSSVAFPVLTNTRSVVAGTYRFHYHDEINGLPTLTLTADVSAADTVLRLASPVDSGKFIQIGREVIQVGDTDTTGATTVMRAKHNTQAADYPSGTTVYQLKEKVTIVPFARNFFGSGASGEWKSSLELPGVRIASAEMYMTNAVGDGSATANEFTSTNDLGLRTLGGGQFSFQITGYLAIQSGAAPVVIVDADRAVRDIYGILRTPAAGAGVTLQINLNGTQYATVQFDPAQTVSRTVNGFGLPPLRAGAELSLDVTGVGTTNPGSDLTLVMRL